MESFPPFHDPFRFPGFAAIPSQDPESITNVAEQNEGLTLRKSYYLIGTISENMTLGTNPTFVCKDRDMALFAVTIKLDPSHGEKFDIKTCKKNHTMVIHEAKKFGVKEGKQGFVETIPAKIKIVPTGAENLIEMSKMADSSFKNRETDGEMRRCQACSTEKGVDGLSRCKGCESVWYCDKACQVQGWNENGHKKYCKILHGVKGLGGQ